MAIYHFAAIRDVYVTEFGGDGIRLRRPVRNGSRDDYSHLFLLENLKVFRNGGAGIVTTDDHAVGPGLLSNVQASSNTGRGYDLIAAGIRLESCFAFTNGGGGLRSRASQNGSISFAQGLTLDTCRIEGNSGIEVEVAGGYDPLLLNCTIQGTTGAQLVVIGTGVDVVKGAVVLGGFFAGNGGAAGTAGQRAFTLGANASNTALLAPWIETAQFHDAYASGNPMASISNSGINTQAWLAGSWRMVQTLRQSAASNVALETRVFTEGARGLGILTSGEHQWGIGTGAFDTNLYRSAANVLKTDDRFEAADSITIKTKAGPPTDADFQATPPDGTLVVDTSTSKLWVRVGGTWKSVTVD